MFSLEIFRKYSLDANLAIWFKYHWRYGSRDQKPYPSLTLVLHTSSLSLVYTFAFLQSFCAMTPHAKYGVKNLFRPFSKYQGSAPEFGATWVCLSALRTLLIRDYAVCIGELSQASFFWTTALITPKYQSAVCSSKNGLLWRAIPYRGVLSGKTDQIKNLEDLRLIQP